MAEKLGIINVQETKKLLDLYRSQGGFRRVLGSFQEDEMIVEVVNKENGFSDIIPLGHSETFTLPTERISIAA